MRVVAEVRGGGVLVLMNNAFRTTGWDLLARGGGAGGRDAKAEGNNLPWQQGQALRQAQGGVREAGDHAA